VLPADLVRERARPHLPDAVQLGRDMRWTSPAANRAPTSSTALQYRVLPTDAAALTVARRLATARQAGPDILIVDAASSMQGDLLPR
jgi:hypothetical protein